MFWLPWPSQVDTYNELSNISNNKVNQCIPEFLFYTFTMQSLMEIHKPTGDSVNVDGAFGCTC